MPKGHTAEVALIKPLRQPTVETVGYKMGLCAT